MKAERLKQKLGKQDFHYDNEEGFVPVTENEKQNQTKQELSEKQIQALRESTQTTTQAIQHSSEFLIEKLQKANKENDEITNRNIQVLTSLVNSTQVDSSIVKTVSNLLNDKNKSPFSLQPVEESSNLFLINPTDPQQVLIKGSTMTFQNGKEYSLNDPDLHHFITNTQFDKEIQNVNAIYNFLKDMKYDLHYGVKKSSRYKIIRYSLQTQLGSALNRFVFLPSDPDELVDQLKLTVLEKVGGNDNPMLSEQIGAIADKLLENECITTNQHQNINSAFTKKDQFVD